MSDQNKPGRRRLKNELLTQVEKTRRYKLSRKLFVDEAAKYGYTAMPMGVVIHKYHIEAIKQIIEGKWRNKLTAGEISQEIFFALKHYIESGYSDIEAVNQDGWPQHGMLEDAERDAGIKFQQWEKQQ